MGLFGVERSLAASAGESAIAQSSLRGVPSLFSLGLRVTPANRGESTGKEHGRNKKRRLRMYRGITYLWLAGNEGMEKKMETSFRAYDGIMEKKMETM